MNLLNRIFSFYVFSNIHVAVSTACLVLLTLDPYPIDPFPTAVFIFFSTVLGYNFIRVMERSRTHPFLDNWTRSSARPLLLVNVISLIGLLIASFRLNIEGLLLLIPFFLLTLFYVYPGSKKFKGLRSLPGLKLFVIALVWSGVTVLFPLVANYLPVGRGEWIVFAQRFFLVLAITIPFDLRDLQFDDEDLATLPQALGPRTSKLIALAGLVLFALPFFFGSYYDPGQRYAGLAIATVSGLLVLKAGIYQERYYSAFWVEAIPILWYLLIVLFP